MDQEFATKLQKFTQVAIKIGVNLQPGQELIMQSINRGGISLEAAPAIRELARAAYQAGSPAVDVLWRDDELRLLSFEYADPESFEQIPARHAQESMSVIQNGGALLTVTAFDPGLLEGQPSELIAEEQKYLQKHTKGIRTLIGKNHMNWSVIPIPVSGWAAKVFPDLPPDQAVPALWEAIFKICRINEEDPIAAWKAHQADLNARADYLNQKAYSELQYSAPGTDLRIRLPEGHIWRSAGFESQSGIKFSANVPTEEVFTIPDTRYTEGTVASARPLAYAGNVIDEFSLTFKEGRVVDFSAKRGEDVLRDLLKIDEGASRLGEVALVPNSSPISQSGLLFYNTLLDENASCHLALGSAFRFSLEGGVEMDAEAFSARGGNSSLIHEDFMVGSGDLDIDGTLSDGTKEPIMRAGEWAY